MTNFEYYKTPKELRKALKKFCRTQKECFDCKYFPKIGEMNCSIQFVYDEHEEEIKPCPFCGGKAEPVDILDYFFVKCSKCHSTGPSMPTKEEAIKEWNKRV